MEEAELRVERERIDKRLDERWKASSQPEPALTEADVDRLEEMIERWDDPKHWSNLVQLPLSKPAKRITWINGMPYEIITSNPRMPSKWFKV